MNQGQYLADGKSDRTTSERESSTVKAMKASGISVDKRIALEPRSKTYVNSLSTVDADKDEKIEMIIRKMPLQNKLLGILAGCKIPGCIIHAIDKEGNILEHYQTEGDIPEALQQGYIVFQQNPGCFSVEVYTLFFCVVYENGTVKFIERNVEQ